MTCDAKVEDRTYTFAELSDKAKEKARDKRRYSPGYLDYDWWEHVYDDAVAMAKSLGLHVGVYQYEIGSGGGFERVLTKPDIWFQYSSSQGDGCCWSGQVHVAELQGAVARVTSEIGQDDTLLELAQVAEQLFAEVAGVAAFNRLCDDDTNRDWPDVAVDMKLSVIGTERYYSTKVDDNLIPDDLAKTANVLVSGFADWIFKQLETEYDYQMSDEVVDGAIDNACLSFDEDGNEL